MDSVLTKAIIANAKGNVDTYVSSVNTLYQELEQVMNTLTGTNFNGDASNGYQSFFRTQVTPALTENLTQQNSLMTSIKSILESIETQLLDTVDPQLGENNQNPGGAG